MHGIYIFTEHTADYISVSRVLSFTACEARQCVNVTILSDIVDEPVEEFDVTLKRTIGLDPRIILQPVDARVIIHSDQGNLYFCSHHMINLVQKQRQNVQIGGGAFSVHKVGHSHLV